MRGKFVVSLLLIAAILLVSSTISVLQYSKMSTYVSGLIADDISSLSASNKLASMSDSYNLELLKRLGEQGDVTLPNFDVAYFRSQCDSLRMASNNTSYAYTDSVLYSFAAYMLTSQEFPDVAQSDLIDSRDWYFNRLQPKYDRLRSDIDKLSYSIHQALVKNSETFDRGFYRSIIPGIVAVMVGLLLVLMLMFFVLSFYVNPLRKMLAGLSAYRSTDKKYTVRFDGDDELVELNEGISEIAGENQQLRRRIKEIRR